MIITIKAKPLTVEGFAPYGKAILFPDDNNPERPTDRFNSRSKLSLLKCGSGVFQVGVSTFFKRPFRTMNLESYGFLRRIRIKGIWRFSLCPTDSLLRRRCEGTII